MPDCADCRFWLPVPMEDAVQEGERPIVGFCRRYPPTREYPRAASGFPEFPLAAAYHRRTHAWDWCGEHQPKVQVVK